MLRPRGVVMHYEVELGLVMGSRLRDLDPKDEKAAMDSIAGEDTIGAHWFATRGLQGMAKY